LGDALHLGGELNGTSRADELGEAAVGSHGEEIALGLGGQGPQSLAEFSKATCRPSRVRGGEPAVSGDVGGQDDGCPAVHCSVPIGGGRSRPPDSNPVWCRTHIPKASK